MTERHADFLVFGSGMGGLTFALRAAEYGTVRVITKKADRESNTNYAQGGIAAVLGPDDSFSRHVDDTLIAGAGLCHPDVVATVVEHAPPLIAWLRDVGVQFSTEQGSNALALGREGGHSARRIVHAADFTGREIEAALLRAVASHPNIELLSHHLAINLITRGSRDGAPHRSVADDRCLGAYVLDTRSGEVDTYTAGVTVLATGGAGKVYLYTTNPDVATADGVAMAWRVGVPVANLEFMQFHPTCLYHPDAKSFLISEAVRGEGAVLTTLDGDPFMARYHAMADLAPRDIVARAIDQEMKRRGDRCVLLDARGIGASRLRERFPTIAQRCADYGIDITTQPIPVVPAAHYMCGGVQASIDGRTALPGLFAIGEVACTGLHGANRLASNSLLEALVAAHLALEPARAALAPPEAIGRVPAWDARAAVPAREAIVIEHTWNEVRTLMWDYVGIVRTAERLEAAARRIAVLRAEIEAYYWRYTLSSDLVELRNIALVAELIVACARRRPESRGLHYLLDGPDAVGAGVDTILAPSEGTLEPPAR